MTTQIHIDVLYGRVDDDDRERAEAAALKVLADAGVTVEAAHEAYTRQWAEFDDRGPMSGLALIWIDAEKAADIALTQGWHDPDGASCSIGL